VRIQRKVGGDWHTIASTFTDSAGVFREPIPDRVGTYRAVAPKVVRRTTSADGRCHQSWSTHDGEDPFQARCERTASRPIRWWMWGILPPIARCTPDAEGPFCDTEGRPNP
jgi:hypothetical protein